MKRCMRKKKKGCSLRGNRWRNGTPTDGSVNDDVADWALKSKRLKEEGKCLTRTDDAFRCSSVQQGIRLELSML